MHSIPFAKRTIWLTKMLALIIGAGGVFGAAIELDMPWFLAILPSGTVIFFALREQVHEFVPPKPVQDASVYQSSWQQYRHLRSIYMRSWGWFGASGLSMILVAALADKLPNTAQISLLALCSLAMIASISMMSFKQNKVDSLALSALRMRFPWFLGEAMAAEKLRLLRTTEGGERNRQFAD